MTPDPATGPTDALQDDPPEDRVFDFEGEPWIVRVCGEAVAGTGRFASAGLQLLRFARLGAAEPARETVSQLRDPDDMYDSELVDLLRGARPIETRFDDEPRRVAPERRFEGEDGGEWN